MKRKVVKQGSATYTVSLPARWVKDFGVKNGDELNVDELGKELVISPGRIATEKKSEIDVSGLSPSLVRRYILSLYIRGADEMAITFSDPKTVRLVQGMVDSLIGLAVVEQKGKAIIVKEVSTPKYEEFDSLLRRIFFTLKSFGEESLERIRGEDWEGMDEMDNMENGVNRLSYLCLRILNKEGYKEFNKTSAIFDVVRFLENIGDEYWSICEYLAETKSRPSGETLEAYRKINGLIEDIYLVFYKFDREKLNAVYERVRKTRKSEISMLSMKKSKEEAVTLYHLRKIAELMSYILESAMIISL
jgi:phosphate uptake regulator